MYYGRYGVFFKFEGEKAFGHSCIVVKARNSHEAVKKVKELLSKLPNVKVSSAIRIYPRKIPLIFKNEDSLNFLMESGHVFTIRTKKRCGYVWITDKRGGKKLADGFIAYVGEVCRLMPDNDWWVVDGAFAIDKLEKFVYHSGFVSVEEWLNAKKELHSGKLPDKMYLHYVVLNPCIGQGGRF